MTSSSQCFWKFAKSWLHLSFHQLLECLVMLTSFKYFIQEWSTMLAKFDTASSNSDIFTTFDISTFAKDAITSLMNSTSSSLFLAIVLLWVMVCSSIIGMMIIRDAWSDVRHYSRWIRWVFSSKESHCRNIKSMTKFKLFALSEYLVGTWSVGYERLKLKESAITKRLLLMEEWWL